MDAANIEKAAQLLAAAQRGARLDGLPEGAQPASFAEAAAGQDRLIELTGEKVAGYKLAGPDPATVMWGAVLESRLHDSPARIPAAAVPLLGAEVEIAFRLDEDVAADDVDWSTERFDAAVTALPVIEIVDSRFEDYQGTPSLHRAADFISNGGLVVGPPLEQWRSIDLERLPVVLSFGGRVVADVVGGHSSGDPRRPALAFFRSPARQRLLPRGTILTTGTYTGLLHAAPGDVVEADLGPFGRLKVEFTR